LYTISSLEKMFRQRQSMQRYHHQQHMSDPMTLRSHFQRYVREWAGMLLRDGVVSDIGHSIFIVLDNRRQWEASGERPHWMKSLGWALLRTAGGQLLRSFLTKQRPDFLRSPRLAVIIAACWALINFSKDDMVYKLFQRQPFKTLIYGLEALFCSKEVSTGVDDFLQRMPKSHVAAIALGVISGCGGTMLHNWARKSPITKSQTKTDWIVKTAFYCTLLYAVPVTETPFGAAYPRVAKYMLRLFYVWAYLWRATHQNGDLFRPAEKSAWFIARIANDLSDKLWHL